MRGKIPWQRAREGRYVIPEWEIEPRATALLLLDLQVAHLDPDRGLGRRLRVDRRLLGAGGYRDGDQGDDDDQGQQHPDHGPASLGTGT